MRPDWSGLQVNMFSTQADMLRENIILDNGSTLSIFSNPERVESIRPSLEALEMSTNAGTITVNLQANVRGFGTVKFH
jgi:SAM-dependent MidA family methyltransferase